MRISRNTHSAILWALEEAIRQPNPFTPDLVEENASMADLMGGGGGPPAVTNGAVGQTTRPTVPPVQTGSPSQGIRGPRMIMRERAEREARRAEREQMERDRAEREARLLEDQKRRDMELRTAAAGAAGAAGGGAQMPSQQGQDTTAQRRQQIPSDTQGRPSQAGPSRIPPTSQPPQQRPGRTNTTQDGAGAAFSGVPTTNVPPVGPSGGQTAEGAGAGAGAGPTRPRNSFPHAFERWEALSAHWEGLTSFWIRRLQQNADEIDRDPLSQQLSRQVTDLSAAGANLFHAVVELQRLRASSERKFQRWFFETRAELERNQEVNGMLEAALGEERRGRADAIRDAVENERANSKTQKQLAEMRKELTISKEEARRAWEELGRREQEERDRTVSLQQGLPTIVGGVQVVPMTQGGIGRQDSARDQRSQQTDSPEYTTRQQQAYPEYSKAPPVQTGASAGPSGSGEEGRFYSQPEAAAHETGSYGRGGSEGGYSEGEYAVDEHGNFIRDSRGYKIPFRGVASPSDDTSDEGAEEQDSLPAARPGPSYPPSSSHQYGGNHAPGSGPDYSGEGYAAPGWETVPRHHHPTRLSDVIEEDDERSRTSASQVSRG